MSYADFFHNAPVLATILTLTYIVLWGMFLYMLYMMYKK